MKVKLLEHHQNVEIAEVLWLALFYHDVIYSALRKDNEEKSTSLFYHRFKESSLENELIHKVFDIIHSTKRHFKTKVPDVDLFLDVDLSILGDHWTNYQKYFEGGKRNMLLCPISFTKKVEEKF